MFKKLWVIILINVIPFIVFIISNLSVDCDLSAEEVFNVEGWWESRATTSVECNIENMNVTLYSDSQ